MSDHETEVRPIMDSVQAYIDKNGPEKGFALMAQMLAVFSLCWSHEPDKLVDTTTAHTKELLKRRQERTTPQ